MLPSRKIFMGITGAALIALGILCICRPVAALVSIGWVIGVIILVSGISTLINWLTVRSYFQQSGSIFFSGLLQVIIGVIFLRHDLPLSFIISLVFAFYLIFEGISLAIRSFDYKKVGYKLWWANLTLGIASAILGFLTLNAPALMSIYLGVGFINVGLVYIAGIFAVNRFEKRINKNPWVDEQ